MTLTLDPAALNEWYCLDAMADIPPGRSGSRLLGIDLVVTRRDGQGDVHVDGDVVVTTEDDEAPLPTRVGHGCLWVTLGHPTRDVPEIPEAAEPDRRVVMCGGITVKTSGLRVMENFLDMAHFPYVHTHVLGVEPHTEVRPYQAEIRRDVDEVWATGCEFFHPQGAKTPADGIMTRYIYRAVRPFVAMLHKTEQGEDDVHARWDVICLFVQPLEPERSRAHVVKYLLDDVSSMTKLVHSQQRIFLQDRIILENQRPTLLPLDPRAEIPTRADATSIAYRRWLRDKGLVYGTTAMAA